MRVETIYFQIHISILIQHFIYAQISRGQWHFILKFETKNYKNYVNESFASRIHDT